MRHVMRLPVLTLLLLILSVTGWGVSLEKWTVEKWTRGHTLALTLTNFFGTTPGQIARGGDGTLHLGFNITRKF